MEELLDLTFNQTPQRQELVTEIEQAQAQVEQVAATLRQVGLGDRAHKFANIAQSISAQQQLLARDWHEEDARARAA